MSVDTPKGIDVEVGFHYGGPPLHYKGHLICYGLTPGSWEASCISCNQGYVLSDSEVPEISEENQPHFWMYMFSKFGECREPRESLAEIVDERTDLKTYVGKINDFSTRANIENDIANSFPDPIKGNIDVNVSPN